MTRFHHGARVFVCACVVPHQITDVLFTFGDVEKHLVVDPHLQAQVVAGRVDLVGLEETKDKRAMSKSTHTPNVNSGICVA